MTIALTGAAGQLGRLTVAALRAQGAADSVVGLVRDLAKGADLGIALRAADYTKPETLVPALAGVSVLGLISANDLGQRTAQHKAVIDAARTAGVGRIVYTSLLHADTSPLDLRTEHLETEAAIRASGLDFTILRNGWYSENYAMAIPGAVGAGAFIGSAGAGRIASAARADYAAALAVALTGTGHSGKVYELAGDSAYSLADLAAEVSRQTGKTIPYNDLPQDVYAGLLKSFGLPDALAEMLAQSDVGASQGGLFDDSHTLSRLIGRPTTPLADVVRAALA